jgi:uncharacterized membrane protein HdeD (DUF308 family)
MRIVWPTNGPQGYWLTPAAVGVLLILVGILIYANPKLLAYFVGGVFVVAGGALITIAWKMRGRVTYRRIDEIGAADDRDQGDDTGTA